MHSYIPRCLIISFCLDREHAPSIIFIDEIDSIGSARMESSGSGDSEVQCTMLELLNQLDGFEATNKIKVLMATNRIDILDQALLRPRRIDGKIEFPNPSETVSDAVLGMLTVFQQSSFQCPQCSTRPGDGNVWASGVA